MPRPPLSSTLFPYTTLFRSISQGLALAVLAWLQTLPEAAVEGVIAWHAGKDPTRAHLAIRSEEHTSELQSPYDLVCSLLLEKKNTITLIHWNSKLSDLSRLT